MSGDASSERKQHARQQAEKHNSEHPATKSNRHKRHLDTKDSENAPDYRPI